MLICSSRARVAGVSDFPVVLFHPATSSPASVKKSSMVFSKRVVMSLAEQRRAGAQETSASPETRPAVRSAVRSAVPGVRAARPVPGIHRRSQSSRSALGAPSSPLSASRAKSSGVPESPKKVCLRRRAGPGDAHIYPGHYDPGLLLDEDSRSSPQSILESLSASLRAVTAPLSIAGTRADRI